jgi:hypothetical protein
MAMRHVHFFVAIVAASLTASAAHAEVIEPDSVAGQNIQVAASFIRANGNPKLANNILEFLAKGYFYRESMTGKVGNTSAFNNIDLDPSVVTPAAGNSIKGQPHYVVQLAAVLAHEKRHAHQHVWDKIGESFKEFDAWTTEILEEDNWIQSLNKKYDESHDPADLALLKEATETKAETLREFIEDQNCFGYGCDVWKKLREAIVELRKVYPEKAPKSEDKRVGMLIDKAKNTERVALAPRAMPPGGCWIDNVGHVVPPNSYTPEGSRFADRFDSRVAIAGTQSFTRLADARWIDPDGGRLVAIDRVLPQGATFDAPGDGNHATRGLDRFSRVACPVKGAPKTDLLNLLPGVGIGVGGRHERRERGDDRRQERHDRPAKTDKPVTRDRPTPRQEMQESR